MTTFMTGALILTARALVLSMPLVDAVAGGWIRAGGRRPQMAPRPGWRALYRAARVAHVQQRCTRLLDQAEQAEAAGDQRRLDRLVSRLEGELATMPDRER